MARKKYAPWISLDIVNSSKVIECDDSVASLVQFLEGLRNDPLSGVGHRGLQ